MSYKYRGVDNFYRETLELTNMIMQQDSNQFGSHGMSKYIRGDEKKKQSKGKKLSENAENFLRKLCADFMSYEFDGIDFPEINYSLMNRTDEVNQDWIEFAKMKGLNSLELQQAGWEMIFGGEFSYVPSLQKFY